MFRWFRDLNVRASWATTPHQLWETRGFAVYEWVARAMLGRPGTNVVVDVCDAYRSNPDWRLIGIDVDPTELALNSMLDEAITADVGNLSAFPREASIWCSAAPSSSISTTPSPSCGMSTRRSSPAAMRSSIRNLSSMNLFVVRRPASDTKSEA